MEDESPMEDEPSPGGRRVLIVPGSNARHDKLRPQAILFRRIHCVLRRHERHHHTAPGALQLQRNCYLRSDA